MLFEIERVVRLAALVCCAVMSSGASCLALTEGEDVLLGPVYAIGSFEPSGDSVNTSGFASLRFVDGVARATVLSAGGEEAVGYEFNVGSRERLLACMATGYAPSRNLEEGLEPSHALLMHSGQVAAGGEESPAALVVLGEQAAMLARTGMEPVGLQLKGARVCGVVSQGSSMYLILLHRGRLVRRQVSLELLMGLDRDALEQLFIASSPESPRGQLPVIAACFGCDRRELIVARADEQVLSISRLSWEASEGAEQALLNVPTPPETRRMEADLSFAEASSGRFIALGLPYADQGSGAVMVFHQKPPSVSREESDWTLVRQIDPEVRVRFGGRLASGGGHSVALVVSAGRSEPRLYVSSPFAGPLSSISCYQPMSGRIEWSQLGVDLPLDRGVIGRRFYIEQAKVGAEAQLVCSCTRFSRSRASAKGLRDDRSSVIALDLVTGEYAERGRK